MFGEKKKEYSSKRGQEIQVWQSPKYEQSKQKALEIINKYKDIGEGDFWILMNESKSGTMIYTGLIISHNACLKINEHLKKEDRFRPECVSIDKDGFGESLVYTYCCPEQGIYEVGEASKANCKNAYPYAMALKRCMDRVILKMSKLAFDGIYSDSEADEFKEKQEAPGEDVPKDGKGDLVNRIQDLAKQKGITKSDICEQGGVKSIADMTEPQMKGCIAWLEKM